MNLFFGLITSSIVGSVVFFTLLLLRPITGKVFSKAWNYYCLVIPLIFLLGGTHIAISLTGLMPYTNPTNTSSIPAQQEILVEIQHEFFMPAVPDDLINMPMRDVEMGIDSAVTPSVTSQTLTYFVRVAPLLLTLWAIGAFIFIAINAAKYIQYRRIMLHNAKSLTGIGCKIPIVTSAAAHTPMLIGVIKPIIILPNMYFADEELEMILAHEMVHYRRKDLFVKLLMLIANAAHWFNPAVYALNRQLNTACELSCDEKVVSEMDEKNRRFYGETILQVLKHSTAQKSLVGNVAFATNLCNSKKNFKRRLASMMNTKKMKKSILALALAAGLLTVGGGFVISNIVDSVMPAVYAGEAESSVQAQGRFSIDIGDFINGVPGSDVISGEAAAHVVADVLANVFGADLNGVTIQTHFCQNTALQLWVGDGRQELDSDWTKFHFRVNAETGDLISIHYNPWDDDAGNVLFNIPYETGSIEQQNIEFARMAMDIVQAHNLLGGAPARARLVSLPTTSSTQGAGVAALVAVQCVNGSIATLNILRYSVNAPDLISITIEIDSLGQSLFQFESDWVINSESSESARQAITPVQNQFQWPLGGYARITVPFGTTTNPISGREEFHTGIDIPAPAGTPILAAKDGYVTFSGWYNGYGNTVIIYHGNSYSTLYAHALRNHVEEGQFVRQGEHIADVGATGVATENHLHFEVRINDIAVDPFTLSPEVQMLEHLNFSSTVPMFIETESGETYVQHIEVRFEDITVDPITFSPEFHINLSPIAPVEHIEIESGEIYVIEFPERNASIEITYILLLLEGSPEVPTMPLENAVRVGANAIYSEFDFCIDGLTGRLLFIDGIDGIQRWVGNIFCEELTAHSDGNELFHFSINAETGEVLGLYMNTEETPFRG